MDKSLKPRWFAGRLRELREHAGLTQQQLAEASGVKLGTIRGLEQGVSLPVWDTALALCQALNVHCCAFTQEPGELPRPAPGRPRKATTELPPAQHKPHGKRK